MKTSKNSQSEAPGTYLAQFIIFGGAIVLRLISENTADYSLILVAGYALFGRAQAIHALALTWLFTMLSEGIAPSFAMASMGRYLVIGSSAVSVLFHSGAIRGEFSINRPLFSTFVLGAFLALHSIIFSPMPDVSILKAVSWTIVMGTLLSAWGGLSDFSRVKLENQVFGGIFVLALVSAPLIYSRVGYLRNEMGFQGILNHPQGFGPSIALLSTWVGCKLLETERPSWSGFGFFGLCLVMIVLSESRTAGLAALFGLISPIALWLLSRKVSFLRLMPGFGSRKLQVVALVSAIALLLFWPALSSRMDDFLTKRSTETSLVKMAQDSRGILVEPMLENIREHPLTGIGFGIASDPAKMEVQRDPVLGLPIGAAIEKGVLPIALLEELGILGSLLVIVWIAPMIGQGFRGGIISFSVLIALFCTNLGEATFFSPGGFGLLPLILFAWAATAKPTPELGRANG